MIKVLVIKSGHFSSFGGLGGIHRHCSALVNLFDGDEDIEIIEEPQFEYYSISLLGKRIYKWNSFYGKLKRIEFDIIHIHGYLQPCVFQAFLAALFLRKKIVYSPHFHPFKYITRPLFGFFFFFFFIKPFLSQVAVTVTLNKEDTSFLKMYSYTRMIPHWYDSFSESMEGKVSGTKEVILFVGRNDKNKGIEHLYVLPYDQYEVHCVTEGYLQRKDFIQHTNASDELLLNLYRRASLVVVPSKYEAFSLVALESLVNSTPVLLSNRVRIADHLDGIVGWRIFDYGDFDDFLSSLPAAISTKVDINSIFERFSPKNIKDMYREVYLYALRSQGSNIKCYKKAKS